MFFDIQGAVDEITATVTNSLGPLANLTTATAADWLGYLADIGIQLASTIILFIIIRFLLWKPITRILEARRDAIDKELNEAKEAKEQAVKLEEELILEKKKAQAEIRDLISNAEKEANLRRDEIINQAKEEAKKRLANLQDELAIEKANMQNDIKQEIIDIAFAAAEKIVSKEVDKDKYLDVIDGILEEAK